MSGKIISLNSNINKEELTTPLEVCHHINYPFWLDMYNLPPVTKLDHRSKFVITASFSLGLRSSSLNNGQGEWRMGSKFDQNRGSTLWYLTISNHLNAMMSL